MLNIITELLPNDSSKLSFCDFHLLSPLASFMLVLLHLLGFHQAGRHVRHRLATEANVVVGDGTVLLQTVPRHLPDPVPSNPEGFLQS